MPGFFFKVYSQVNSGRKLFWQVESKVYSRRLFVLYLGLKWSTKAHERQKILPCGRQACGGEMLANPMPPCPQWFLFLLPESSARGWQPPLIQPVVCSGTRVGKPISPLPLSTYKWTTLSLPVYASGCQAPREDKTPLEDTHDCFHALLSVGLQAAWTGTVLDRW